MQLFFYASSADANRGQLVRKITAQNGTVSIEQYNTIEGLLQSLRSPISAPLVAILWPRDNTELDTLIKMRHLLRNSRIILILPNRSNNTISQSHLLRPRYISHSDSNLTDVVAVVDKMAQLEKTYMAEAV